MIFRRAKQIAIGTLLLLFVAAQSPQHQRVEQLPPGPVPPPKSWDVLQQGIAEQSKWYAAASTPPARISLPARPRSSGTVSSAATDGSVWDRIAACESGGNWAENSENGYFGGLQEDMQFWRSYGGFEYAERPDLASREQQIIVAERARDSGRGYSPWPICGRRA